MAEMTLATALVEGTDRWELWLRERLVTQCRFDHAFTIILDHPNGALEIRIGEPFTISTARGDEVTLKPEAEPAAMGPALVVLRRIVERVLAFKDGRLELQFGDGGRLRVPAGEEFEAWDLVGPAGLRIVSLPRGELAIWKPEWRDAAAG